MEKAERFPCPAVSLVVLFAALIVACDDSAPPKRYWRQFHGDGANQGFLDVTTPADLRPRWSVDLGGRVRFSSVVTDPDGSLFVAVDNSVVKVSPAGQIQWRHDFAPAYATSTPAVADDGRVCVVVNQRLGPKSYTNFLHCLSSGGSLLWTRSFAGVQAAPAFGAPKIWEREKRSALFVYANDMLYAFSLDGRLLRGLHDPHHCTVVYGTSWFWDTVELVWDAIKNAGMKTFDINALSEYGDLAWPDPTPAVIDYEGSPYVDTPLAVTADYCGMAGFKWDPGTEELSVVWTYNHGDAAKLATPAVSAVGTLVTARKSGETGTVQFFDIFHDTSKASKVNEYNIRDDYAGPPAAIWLGAYFYVAGQHRLYRFDGIGQLVSSVAFEGRTFAAPSCSQNWIYVSTTSGLEVFDPELQQHSVLSTTPYGAGISAPTIARDGTVYIVDLAGVLHAY
jgi:hypothetical protein